MGCLGLAMRVLPTRVGMVRQKNVCADSPSGSPHARGDGPSKRWCSGTFCAFSPRAWGWSGSIKTVPPLAGVLPTRVGMVRAALTQSDHAGGSPHARGDGPRTANWNCRKGGFFPRAWGWSGSPLRIWQRLHVLPTRVGMVRIAPTNMAKIARSAPARGRRFKQGHRFEI
jgi:hypothetical protein